MLCFLWLLAWKHFFTVLLGNTHVTPLPNEDAYVPADFDINATGRTYPETDMPTGWIRCTVNLGDGSDCAPITLTDVEAGVNWGNGSGG